MPSLLDHFLDLPDPRVERTKLYLLINSDLGIVHFENSDYLPPKEWKIGYAAKMVDV